MKVKALRKTIVATVVAFAALTVDGAAQDKPKDSANKALQHDALSMWAGHWKVRIETKETQFGHAGTQDFDSKCSFLPNGAFMACEYLSLQPDPNTGHIINDVALVYYSDVDKTFKYTNVAPEGGPRENLMSVDGTVWTRPFDIPTKHGEVLKAREIYDFVSPKRQLARLEISTDEGAHWTVVNEAVGTKE
jgi:hypothetical protein